MNRIDVLYGVSAATAYDTTESKVGGCDAKA